jgi:hypothetical protein
MTPSNETASPLIKPTIGRKVWFHPNGMKESAAGKPVDVFVKEQPLDATVVCVWGDRLVNLGVIDHGGAVHSIRSCPFRHPNDPVPGGYYCEWMPFQTGQAKAQAIAQQHAIPSGEVDLEKAIVLAGAGEFARLTPAHIEAQIVGEYFHVPPDTFLTLCMLTLRNGFTVIGESACASPENFNAEIGQRVARENARAKIWVLEGYLLRERLAAAKR